MPGRATHQRRDLPTLPPHGCFHPARSPVTMERCRLRGTLQPPVWSPSTGPVASASRPSARSTPHRRRYLRPLIDEPQPESVETDTGDRAPNTWPCTHPAEFVRSRALPVAIGVLPVHSVLFRCFDDAKSWERQGKYLGGPVHIGEAAEAGDLLRLVGEVFECLDNG